MSAQRCHNDAFDALITTILTMSTKISPENSAVIDNNCRTNCFDIALDFGCDMVCAKASTLCLLVWVI